MEWKQDAPQLKEAFDRKGYLVLRGFMSGAEAQEINRQIERYIADVLPTLPENEAFYEVKNDPQTIMRLQNMCGNDAFFKQMSTSEHFVELSEFLMQDQVVGKPLQWFNKPARVGKVTPPHQDGFYFMLEPNEALTLWLALDKIDAENGCLRFVPGSRWEEMRPHQRSNVLGFSQGITDYGPADYQNEVAISAEPGDLIVHHCMTIHRADANPSERPRRALGFVYYAQRAKKDEERAEAYRKTLFAAWEREGKL